MIGIYGANGFIGKHLVQRLASDGRPTRAVVRTFSGQHDPAAPVEKVEADFRNPDELRATLEGLDVVVQLVSSSSPGHQNNRSILDIQDNVIPHVSFLRQCVEAGIRRYIFLSSGGTVYGNAGSSPIKETAPTNPVCSHGLTKLMVEKYISMHGHIDGLEYVILRISNPYGPSQVFRNGQGLIPALMDRHMQGEPVHIFGDGSAARDYIYIDDVISAIVKAIDLEGSPQEIINIGTGVSRSITEVVQMIEKVAGINFVIEHVAARKTDVRTSCLDVSKARVILGWEPEVEFLDGLSRTLIGQVMWG